MTSLTIKNIPDELYERLKSSAAQHHRSVNSEVIACLEKALSSAPVDPASFLAGVRTFRKSVSRVFVTDEDLQIAKGEGRL